MFRHRAERDVVDSRLRTFCYSFSLPQSDVRPALEIFQFTPKTDHEKKQQLHGNKRNHLEILKKNKQSDQLLLPLSCLTFFLQNALVLGVKKKDLAALNPTSLTDTLHLSVQAAWWNQREPGRSHHIRIYPHLGEQVWVRGLIFCMGPTFDYPFFYYFTCCYLLTI